MSKCAWVTLGGYALLLAIAVALPLVVTDVYMLSILITALIGVTGAVSLYVAFLIGQFSAAHAAFMAIGAYTSGLLALRSGLSFWLALPIAGVTATLVAVAFGYLTLRIRGLYFLLVTFAFNELVRQVITGWPSVLGGINGIPGIPIADPIVIPGVVVLLFNSRMAQYYLILVITLACIVFVHRLQKSRLGSIFRSISENPALAESVGINTLRYQVLAFAIASFWAGILGSFLAQYLRLLHLDSFTVWRSISFAVFNQVGGLGSLAGPVIGAILLTILPEAGRIAQKYEPLISGAALVLVMRFLPGGLVGLRELIPGWFSKASRPGKTARKTDAAHG